MYEVQFDLNGKLYELPFSTNIPCGDLERALALASLLQKISTDLVKYERIIVKPLSLNEHEMEKK